MSADLPLSSFLLVYAGTLAIGAGFFVFLMAAASIVLLISGLAAGVVASLRKLSLLIGATGSIARAALWSPATLRASTHPRLFAPEQDPAQPIVARW